MDILQRRLELTLAGADCDPKGKYLSLGSDVHVQRRIEWAQRRAAQRTTGVREWRVEVVNCLRFTPATSLPVIWQEPPRVRKVAPGQLLFAIHHHVSRAEFSSPQRYQSPSGRQRQRDSSPGVPLRRQERDAFPAGPAPGPAAAECIRQVRAPVVGEEQVYHYREG